MMNLYCEHCASDKKLCNYCIKNPKYQHLKNYFKDYEPVCPIGRAHCVCDPAYIKCYHPKWYEELYGDKTPQEVALKCQYRLENDPNWVCRDYDTEDK